MSVVDCTCMLLEQMGKIRIHNYRCKTDVKMFATSLKSTFNLLAFLRRRKVCSQH